MSKWGVILNGSNIYSCQFWGVFNVLFLFLYRCTFERSLCQWQQLPDDDFDWTRNQGSTASYGTGPMFDHTLGSSAGNLLTVLALLVC